MSTQQHESATDGQTRIYRARQIEQILPRIKAELGPDAIVVAQLPADARDELLERAPAVGEGLLVLWCHQAVTTPIVSTPIPGAISL